VHGGGDVSDGQAGQRGEEVGFVVGEEWGGVVGEVGEHGGDLAA
jgi:hypothetical protein